MSIHFIEAFKTFYLESTDSTYAILINEYGYTEHLYYGAKIPFENLQLLKVSGLSSCVVSVPGSDKNDSFHHMASEFSFFGSGDYREPTVEIVFPNGSRVCDFRYKSYDILQNKPALNGMPSLLGGETLVLHLADAYAPVECDLYYTVYEDCSVIARHAVYHNSGKEPIQLERAYSFAMTLPDNRYQILSLHGVWGQECQMETSSLHHGTFVIDSKRTTSSATLNPFLAVMEPDTDEIHGKIWGFSLIYSSSFVLKAEGDSVGRTLVTGGINDFGFSWKLNEGETFETPEVVIAFSKEGIGGMSRAYHRAFRKYLISPTYVRASRPVVINNWEGTFFDFNTEKLEAIAKGVAGTGIDTFVLDDGWFGKRDNDKSGLGDWFVNENKLNGGLDHIISTVNRLGMKFGLWFEPEMISEDSDLFRAHPDYAIGVPGRPRCSSRTQFVLDLTRKDVRDYIVNAVNKVLQEHHIEYVKWDYNRNVTDAFSLELPADRQAEFAHRYVLGFYDLCNHIVSANPKIFFEGCSAGGGRFDPAMLYYFPQIWTSDDTDAEERTKIQYGTSIVYPLSAMSCHISVSPNIQTGRTISMKTRADIAHLGATGYELNTSNYTDEDRAMVKEQIKNYREMEHLVLNGDLYRLDSPFTSNQFGFELVSDDKKEAMVIFYRRMSRANNGCYRRCLQGLDKNKIYLVKELNTSFTGVVLMEYGLPMVAGKNDFKTRIYHLSELKN